jgi:two-component system cell cycle response regulator
MSLSSGRQRDLVPLGRRLGVLNLLRVGLAGGVLAAALLAPETVGAGWRVLAAPTAGYVVLAAVTEALRRAVRRLPLPVVGATLLLDGVYIAAVLSMTGGPRSVLGPLTFLHLVAVTLLASYRTGLKIALWHTVLLVAAHTLQGRTSVRAAVFSVTAFWAVAITTATFSALNERELRRSRAAFRALAEMGARLEEARDSDAVVAVLLEAVTSWLGCGRAAALLVSGDRAGATTLVGGVRAHTPLGDAPLGALVERTAATRTPILARRLDAHSVLALALPDARNVVLLPLLVDGAPVGVLAVERGGVAGTRMPAATLATLTQFASHAALAHRNTELLAEVQRLATIDGLTGLANRRAFEEILAREVARSHRTGDPVTLLLLDVDHFKQVNDTYGHPMGDEVLRHVGRVLAALQRGTDVAARYGGEEFAVVLPGCSPEGAMIVAERLRGGIAGEGCPLPLTVSAGCATLPVTASDGATLVKAADAALYKAKLGGRDRTVCAQPEPDRTEVTELTRTVSAAGVVHVAGLRVGVGRALAGRQVRVRVGPDAVRVYCGDELVTSVARRAAG